MFLILVKWEKYYINSYDSISSLKNNLAKKIINPYIQVNQFDVCN